MRAFLCAPRKINLVCTVNRSSGSPTVLKNILNKKNKIKTCSIKVKDICDNPPSLFFFDKTYHLVLRDSALVYPKCTSRVQYFKVYFFVSCFSKMSLNKIKLKLGTMMLNAYEKNYADD